MKASELIEALKEGIERVGDQQIHIEAELNGARTEQTASDVLFGRNRILLVSKEAMDADPINALPIIERETN